MTAAILFDLDGVLVDSRAPIASCVNAILRAHDFPELPDEKIHALIGPPLHATFAMLVGAERAERCVADYRELYARRAPLETPVFDGIPDVLQGLAGRPLAVATSKPRVLAEPLLEAVGLRAHFAAVCGPPLEHDVPKAEIVGEALTALGAREATMVGDTRFDVAAARANGIPLVGVLWGIGTRDELAGADALVATPAELLEALR